MPVQCDLLPMQSPIHLRIVLEPRLSARTIATQRRHLRERHVVPPQRTAPSPIAAPTRLTDPDRTSPMANTPRTLVSSGSGRPDRLFDQPTSDGTSEPVRMKFLASKMTALSLSQVVAGSAPMKRKRWRIGFSVSSPVTLLRQRTRSSCFSGLPCRATISVWVNTSILSVASMRSMRYCDMLSARLGPRTSIQIFAAKLRRKTAA